MQCHAQIEKVHAQVIRGELWEKEPGAIPACTDCHRPHKARRELVAMTISDRDCLKCHQSEDLFKVADGDSLSMHVDMATLRHSAHETIPCVKCHSDIDPRLDRPCTHAGTVDCSDCHAAVSEEYDLSGHGTAHAQGVEDAPSCTTCHGDHEILSKSEDESPIFRSNVPTLCAECHKDEGVAGQHAEVENPEAGSQYATSVHGRALIEMGLLPSAICTDCHSSHMILDHRDERSTVNHRNLSTTCATCHRGIYKNFIQSVHYSNDPQIEKNLPSCANCHSSHEIAETDEDAFVVEVTKQCGSCHADLAETYFETMHGKAYVLGYTDAAKCSDCHGTHGILGHDDIGSMTHQRNIVETCKKCHEDANQRFTGYLTHATHHDPDRYPYLYYAYWTMTGLLLSVFTVFGLHTLLWMPRSFRAMWRRRRETRLHAPTKYIRRFTREQRIMHFFVIISFLSLALTGMMLKFASMGWAAYLADMLGGARNAGLIHRAAAIITFGYFAWHLRVLLRYKRSANISWIQLAFGPDSLMFNMNDAKDFVGTVKWFLGRGPRPQYGRWTYWEKFDYLAVFWGVAVIGLSGLMLWFPERFTLLLPGWVINVATIIHSDEALLAVGFIFTVHFFNTHLRPEAFPMDTVIFTGVVPLEHYREERGREVEELEATGKIDEVTVDEVHISPTRMWAIRIFGFSALFTGIVLVGLIIYSMLAGYK